MPESEPGPLWPQLIDWRKVETRTNGWDLGACRGSRLFPRHVSKVYDTSGGAPRLSAGTSWVGSKENCHSGLIGSTRSVTSPGVREVRSNVRKDLPCAHVCGCRFLSSPCVFPAPTFSYRAGRAALTFRTTRTEGISQAEAAEETSDCGLGNSDCGLKSLFDALKSAIRNPNSKSMSVVTVTPVQPHAHHTEADEADRRWLILH